MRIPSPPTLIDLLRSTLKQMERDEEFSSDDPAALELKASLLRAIAELELRKADKISAA
jgi:hypothetical protein